MISLSIIVPVYNVEPYLRKCVDSLLAQDIPAEDYEIILVDDGSTDNSGSICDEYAGCSSLSPLKTEEGVEIPSIRVIHQPNAGVSAARNNGVAIANAPYVAFLDADDWWDTHFARKMLDFIEQHPGAGLYACKFWYVKNGRNEDRIMNLCWTDAGHINYFKSYYDGWAMPIWTGAAVMPKMVFAEMGGFPSGIKLGEDFLLWAKTAMHYPIAYLDECLSYYNNDIPAAQRATKRLYPFEHNMLSRFEELNLYSIRNQALYNDWSRLRDKLRAIGLRQYWLSDEYGDQYANIIQTELHTINWSHLPKAYQHWYMRPRWYHRIMSTIRKWGSRIKHSLM